MSEDFRIQHFRGVEANLPTLAVGQLAITTDTDKLFVGSAGGNVHLNAGTGHGTGVVTAHSDVSSAGSGSIITTGERSAISTNTTHGGLTNNPHSVSKGDVGLGSVPNADTTDAINKAHNESHALASHTDGFAPAYAHIYKTDSDNLSATGTWRDVKFAEASGIKVGITHSHTSSQELIGLDDEGVYKVFWRITFDNVHTTSTGYYTRLVLEGVEVEGSWACMRPYGNTHYNQLCGSAIVVSDADDEDIKVQAAGMATNSNLEAYSVNNPTTTDLVSAAITIHRIA